LVPNTAPHGAEVTTNSAHWQQISHDNVLYKQHMNHGLATNN
jgi:hypothetical protein